MLLSFIWQWTLNVKRETVFIYIYILMFSVHVVIKFQGGNMSGGDISGSPLKKTLQVATLKYCTFTVCEVVLSGGAHELGKVVHTYMN